MRTQVCSSTHTTINKILMISNTTTNLNVITHPIRASFSCLDLSCSLPPPFPSPSPYLHLTATHRHRFLEILQEGLGEQGFFSCDLNWDSVGTFLKMAGREFQRDGAMKLNVVMCASIIYACVCMHACACVWECVCLTHLYACEYTCTFSEDHHNTHDISMHKTTQ